MLSNPGGGNFSAMVSAGEHSRDSSKNYLLLFTRSELPLIPVQYTRPAESTGHTRRPQHHIRPCKPTKQSTKAPRHIERKTNTSVAFNHSLLSTKCFLSKPGEDRTALQRQKEPNLNNPPQEQDDTNPRQTRQLRAQIHHSLLRGMGSAMAEVELACWGWACGAPPLPCPGSLQGTAIESQQNKAD